MPDNIPNQPEQAATDTDALENSEESLSSAFGNGLRDSGHDVRITRSHVYDMNSQLVREEIASLRLLNSETEQRIRHTEQMFQDSRTVQMQLMDAQRKRESDSANLANTNATSLAQQNSTNANSEALAQMQTSVDINQFKQLMAEANTAITKATKPLQNAVNILKRHNENPEGFVGYLEGDTSRTIFDIADLLLVEDPQTAFSNCALKPPEEY